MRYSAEELRNLLSVAKKLRHLAQDAPDCDDRALYTEAAAALEARAQWQANHLPDDRDVHPVPAFRPQHVDLLV